MYTVQFLTISSALEQFFFLLLVSYEHCEHADVAVTTHDLKILN